MEGATGEMDEEEEEVKEEECNETVGGEGLEEREYK